MNKLHEVRAKIASNKDKLNDESAAKVIADLNNKINKFLKESSSTMFEIQADVTSGNTEIVFAKVAAHFSGFKAKLTTPTLSYMDQDNPCTPYISLTLE